MEWRLMGSVTSAECCEFAKKNEPIPSEGIVQIGCRSCSNFPLLLSEAHWNTTTNYFRSSSSSTTVVERRSTSCFEYWRTTLCSRWSNGILEWSLFESRPRVVSSIWITDSSHRRISYTAQYVSTFNLYNYKIRQLWVRLNEAWIWVTWELGR